MRGYRATQQPDGTWTIHDVPIMAEYAGGRSFLEKVDRDWMAAALERCRFREQQDGYLPPCHVYHHGDGQPTQRVGFFRLTRVARAPLEGKVRWTLFADLTGIPPETYSRIKDGSLPYRSVEVLDPKGKPEVDSLALLEDEVPFFRFGLLKIAEERPLEVETALQRLEEHSAPAVAVMAAQGSATRVLFRFQEGSSMPENQEGTPATPAAPSSEEKLDQILQMLTAIAKALGGGGESMEKSGDESPVEMAEDKDEKEEMKASPPEEPAKATAAADPKDQEIARLSARLSALEKVDQARNEREARTGLVAAAKAKLKGWPLTKADEADLERFAAQGKAVLDAFVEAYQRNTPQDPPPDFGSFVGRAKAEDPPEVMAFASEGADKLHMARKAYAMFRDASRLPGFRVSREVFIKDQVQRMEREAAAKNGNGEVD